MAVKGPSGIGQSCEMLYLGINGTTGIVITRKDQSYLYTGLDPKRSHLSALFISYFRHI